MCFGFGFFLTVRCFAGCSGSIRPPRHAGLASSRLAADVASDCPPRHADLRTGVTAGCREAVSAAGTSLGDATPATCLLITRADDRQLGLFDLCWRLIPSTPFATRALTANTQTSITVSVTPNHKTRSYIKGDIKCPQLSIQLLAPVALFVASWYALPGYGADESGFKAQAGRIICVRL